jgi:hypothetical protein
MAPLLRPLLLFLDPEKSAVEETGVFEALLMEAEYGSEVMDAEDEEEEDELTAEVVG